MQIGVDGIVWPGIDRLRQVADLLVRDRDRTPVRLFQPQNYLEKRGLATAIGRHKPDLVVVIDTKGDILKQEFDTIRLGEILDVEHGDIVACGRNLESSKVI